MGIDLYLNWDGQNEKEKEAQYTGFSIKSGHTGYLREAYHGGPYATKVLAPEAFDETSGPKHTCMENEDGCEACKGVRILAHVLRERLPAVLDAARERERIIYKEREPDEDVLKAFVSFVELAEAKEAEGKNPRVCASF